MTRATALDRTAHAVFRALFWLALRPAPAAFRRHYASRMFDVHSDAVAQAYRANGALGAMLACFGGCADALRASLAERAALIARDLSAARRSLLRAPLVTFVSVAAIALGLGANLTVASVIEGVFLRPLPYADPGQLLFVQESNGGHSLSYPDAQRLAGRVAAYATLALSAFDNRTLLGRGRPVALQGAIVSDNYFAVLGIEPELGSFFSTSDLGRRIAVISNAQWRERFGGTANVLGRVIHLDDRGYTIVGVAPARFRDPTPYGFAPRDYWIPIDPTDPHQVDAGAFNDNVIARVASGLNVDAAGRDIRAALAVIERRRPANDSHLCCVNASSLRDTLLGPVGPLLWSLYAIVTIVLLVACVNVANLQVARNAARENELAVRSALGASPRRIATELLTEMLMLAIAGAALGICLAVLGLDALASFGSIVLPRWEDVRVDSPLLAYAAMLVPLTTLAAGFLPALERRRDVARALVAERVTERRSTKRLRTALVAGEVALATVLVICAGLVLRSFFAFTHVSLGFDPARAYVIHFETPVAARYPTDTARLAFARHVTAGLTRIPGVVDVTATSQLPFECCSSTSFTLPGRRSVRTDILYTAIAPNYFRALRIPLVRGRTFTPKDRAGSACVVIVDLSFARRYLGSGDVLGRVVVPSLGPATSRCTIVGLVGTVRETFGTPPAPMLYLPSAQEPELRDVFLRTDRPSNELANRVAAVFAKVDPTLPAPPVASFASIFADGALGQRMNAVLFGVLAALALVLALSGIYAVTAYSVAQRTHEFGIRMAVGASSASLLRTVLAGALAYSGAGIALGVVLTAAVSRYLDALLYQTSPFDPLTFSAALVLFALCASVAALIPAWRATSIDPAAALRQS